MTQDNYLFSSRELREVLQARRETLVKELQSFAADYILNVNEDDLVAHLVEKYQMEPPTLHPEQATTTGTQDVQIDVSGDIRYGIFDRSRPHYVTGTKITLSIPFSGDVELFFVQASTYPTNPPRGTVRESALELSFQQLEADQDQLKRDYEQTVKRVGELLQWVRNDVQTYNGHLSDLVLNTLQQRKQKLLKDRKLEAALGIPLQRSATPPLPPVIKRKVFARPRASTTTFTPDPIVPDAEYDHILSIIENMIMVMERSPQAFATMDEESLRTHILVQLNGHYEGQATGETFNFAGKTDILIRASGKNVFVAECKFWTGPKGFLDTIDQLLSYTTYRDTKTAVIVFNKNQEHTSVLQKITDTTPTHPQYKRDLGNKSEAHSRYLFRHPNDAQRDIYVAVLSFHIPPAQA